MGAVSAHDVAAYVLAAQPAPITTMKLQKLVYYSQAWHLAWTGKPLFKEEIQAWANGPVVYELFRSHRGKYVITAGQLGAGDPGALNASQRSVVDAVVASYSKLTASQLSILTHSEQPWKSARGAAGAGANSSAPIKHTVMREYYRSLQKAGDTVDPADAFATTT